MPKQIFMLASVVTNGLTRSHATAMPLKSPTSSPIKRPDAVPARAAMIPLEPSEPTMAVIVRALATLIIDTLGPNDKSSPRVSSTIVCAHVSTNKNAVCWIMLMIFSSDSTAGT